MLPALHAQPPLTAPPRAHTTSAAYLALSGLSGVAAAALELAPVQTLEALGGGTALVTSTSLQVYGGALHWT